jgi:nitroreductase
VTSQDGTAGTHPLGLSVDEVLSTTRAVRKRLDFTRPVPDDVIRECVRLAVQAPAGSNIPRTRFVVVRDAETRRALAAIYHDVYSDLYRKSASYVRRVGAPAGGSAVDDRQQRVGDSVDYLAEHLAEAPVIVVACLAGMRVDGPLANMATTFLGQTGPAMWSFMLAARARGIGTCWTTMHMPREREAAELLGIPYDTVQQVCLSPLAYTIGTNFKPAQRDEPETYIHWDRWDPTKPVPDAWKGFAKTDTSEGDEMEMTDVEQIINVMSRYGRAVDDRDFDALAALLADDVRFEMGDVTESRRELLDYMQENLWPAGRHIVVNPAVTVDGDTAHADSDWIWLDPGFAIAGVGRYSDDFRREGGRWIFTVRRISFAAKAET